MLPEHVQGQIKCYGEGRRLGRYAVLGIWDIFLGLGRILGVGITYVTSFDNIVSFLSGVGAVNFIFCCRVAFLFRVTAAYVICGEVFGGVSTLGSGAGCG